MVFNTARLNLFCRDYFVELSKNYTSGLNMLSIAAHQNLCSSIELVIDT